MRRIDVAIEVADEKLDADELRINTAQRCGVRIVFGAEYANKLLLVVPEPDEDGTLPPVRLDTLRAALERFGVTVVAQSAVEDALSSGVHSEIVSATKELRRLFREFKSNPLSRVELRGKTPADPIKRQRREAAKRFKDDFYEARLPEFIVRHPGLSFRDYWDADGRPYDKQWPEYRLACRIAKDLRGKEESR